MMAGPGFEKKDAERELKKAAVLDAALLHRMNDLAWQGIILTDTDLLVCAWNQWLEEHTEIKSDDAIGENLLVLFPSLVERGLARQYQWALEGEVRILSQRLHGYLLPMEPASEAMGFTYMQQSARISPLIENERVVGTVTVIDDVTERVAREAELETQIEFGKQMLAREHAAREEAEKANHLKDEFLATISHELRTPLNAIMGWTQLLRSGSLDPATSIRAIETIQRNAESQNSLISDLLDFVRIASGKLSLDRRPFNLSPLITASLDAVRPAAEAKDVNLESSIDVTADLILADANRIQQVIWNVLSNAVKFTPPGGYVRVTLRQVGDDVHLTIADSGVGISAEFLPHVFDRFRQADGATTKNQTGLGLGLSIVRHLVELHYGKVKAESAGEGKGASFVITLPLAAAEITEVGDRRSEINEAFTCPPALENLHVMVVDDDDDTCELLCALLEGCGCLVTTARSAAEAFDSILAHLPDVLVSDIGMPGEDGYSLIARVRALPASKGGSLPAIALTAYAAVTDAERMILSGFQIHLAKPLQVNELLSAIEGLVTAASKFSPGPSNQDEV
jgi:signal transduction histidine kinase/ActR/RegA family two-component response regulator